MKTSWPSIVRHWLSYRMRSGCEKARAGSAWLRNMAARPRSNVSAALKWLPVNRPGLKKVKDLEFIQMNCIGKTSIVADFKNLVAAIVRFCSGEVKFTGMRI